MTSQREREGRTLDCFVEMSVADVPSLEEADEELRSAGIDPVQLGRALRERIVQATWRKEAQARRAWFASRNTARAPRPSGMTRAEIIGRIQQHNAGVAFRNADKMSDDDLWDTLCDLELPNE
ncbi:MAG: hypothetical protein RBU37_09645 [Myxococcota bacterium]|jgi:hypothetical protein|nr:hypothetical protein [Myxococcota bacterium]